MLLKRLIIFCFIFSTTQIWAQWGRIYTSNVNDLYDVQQINGYAFIVGQSNTVMISKDTGKTWKNQFVSIPTHLRALCFVDTSIGFVAGENARVFKTIDGGKTWISKYVRTAAYAYGISFSGNNGLLVGADLLIASSKDLGETWKVDTTLKSNIVLKSVAITNNGTCFAVGDSGYVLKKEINRGLWQKINVPTAINLNKVLTFNDSIVLIFGGMRDSNQVGKHLNVILRSENSGKTWSKTIAPEMKSIFCAWFLNKDTGFIGGSSGLIAKTDSVFGQRSLLNVATASDINNMSFYGSVGLAVSYGGLILRTINNGGYGLNVNEETLHPIKFYPNPSANKVFIETKENGTIEFYSSIHQLVLIQPIKIGVNEIDVSSLKNGVYFIKDLNNNTFSKLVVLH